MSICTLPPLPAVPTVDELREKLRALNYEELGLCRLHSKWHRHVTCLEDLDAAELREWLSLCDFAVRRGGL